MAQPPDELSAALAAWRDEVFVAFGWSPGAAMLAPQTDAVAAGRFLNNAIRASARRALATMPRDIVRGLVEEARAALAQGDLARAATVAALLDDDTPPADAPFDGARLATLWRKACAATEAAIAAVQRAATAEHPDLARDLAIMDQAPGLFATDLEALLAAAATGERTDADSLTRALGLAEALRTSLAGNAFLLHMKKNPYLPMDPAGFLCARLETVTTEIRRGLAED
jgi:hypothetical protein